jgi:hypothetical protein
MDIDNGKLIEKFNVIPEFYKEIIIINRWVEFGGGQTKTIPNALTGFCVHLIPPVLALHFFSLPIHFYLELTLKMTKIFLFHSWLYLFWNTQIMFCLLLIEYFNNVCFIINLYHYPVNIFFF